MKDTHIHAARSLIEKLHTRGYSAHEILTCCGLMSYELDEEELLEFLASISPQFQETREFPECDRKAS